MTDAAINSCTSIVCVECSCFGRNIAVYYLRETGKDADSIAIPAVYGICEPMCFGGVGEPD